MKLPTFQTAHENLSLGVATPLEKFVFEYEPVENDDATIWRSDLEELIGYVIVHTGDCSQDSCSCSCQEQLELPLDTEPE